MRVLVTGSNGFVGSRIVAELAKSGCDVIAVSGPNSRGELFSVDVADPLSVEQLNSLERVDVVIHAAAIAHRFARVNESDFSRVNVDGVENIAKLAIRLRAEHFVLFSSTLVYGRRDPETLITEEFDCQPASSYGQSKLDGELAAKKVCETNGINLTILRPSPIIGEGSKGNFNRLIRAIDKKRFVMVGNGENRKSLIYVVDAAKAVAKIIEQNGNKTQIFNLTGGDIRMNEIVKTIETGLGRTALPFRIAPKPLKILANAASKIVFLQRLKNFSSTLETWLSDDVYSNSKLRSVYDFNAETSIVDAIKQETAFYLNKR